MSYVEEKGKNKKVKTKLCSKLTPYAYSIFATNDSCSLTIYSNQDCRNPTIASSRQKVTPAVSAPLFDHSNKIAPI
jgi:hypothetical protein